jgi:hypothetical protein
LILRDGAMLRLRFLRPGDHGVLKDLLSRCTPETIRYRFLHSIKTLPETMFDHLSQVDGSRDVALVMLQCSGADERIIAVDHIWFIISKPLIRSPPPRRLYGA